LKNIFDGVGILEKALLSGEQKGKSGLEKAPVLLTPTSSKQGLKF